MITQWFSSLLVYNPVRTGQVSFTTPGTYTWVVPEGVTKVSCVVIGAGGQGTLYVGVNGHGGGEGGALRYKNNIDVTPGQSYTVVVGSGGITGETTYNFQITDTANHVSSALGLSAGAGVTGTAFGNGVLGGNGGTAMSANGLSAISAGGPCATYVNGTNRAAASGTSCGGGTGLYGVVTGGGGTYQAGTCGGGGNSTGPNQNVGYATKSYRKGGDGGVRIIWGEGRAFPTTNVGDLT